MYVCLSVHVSVDADGDQKRAADPLKQKIQIAVTCLKWLLGIKLGSSTREPSPPHFPSTSLLTFVQSYVRYLLVTSNLSRLTVLPLNHKT